MVEPTPQTDAAMIYRQGDVFPQIEAEFCRGMERSRNKWRECSEALAQALLQVEPRSEQAEAALVLFAETSGA
jgi:hypothetical protein